MVDGSLSRVSLRDIVIVGGGCYGSFYAGQLQTARQRGRASYRQLLIVDRNPECRVALEMSDDPTCRLIVEEWGEFFDRFLSSAVAEETDQPGDAIVPSPLMPHLMYQWLLRRARMHWPGRSIQTKPVPAGLGTPYDVMAPDHTRYVSFADWICPTHCIEPATCPVIRAPRTWEMGDAVTALARRLGNSHPTAGPVLFLCHHRVFGVGMFDVSAVLAGEVMMVSAGAPGTAVDLLVGTISHCHGAVNLLSLGAWP